MPFIAHTPESLIPRSDSKNPAATCKGLTSNGRPCRRAIGGSVRSKQPVSSREPDSFCWQHKDQVLSVGAQQPGPQHAFIKKRTSVDSLVDRLGILEIDTGSRRQRDGKENPAQERPPRGEYHEQTRPRKKPKSNLALFCCIGTVDDDEPIAPRHVVRPSDRGKSGIASKSTAPSSQFLSTATFTEQRPTGNGTTQKKPGRTPDHASTRPHVARKPSSQTSQFLSLIPETTSPQITSLLLAELAKPVSSFDEEGYIYMFWLTPDTLPSAPTETAHTLLEAPARPVPGGRRTSDVLNSFAKSSPNSSKTILLKIGRASNVQRRLNQWTRQCGYNLSLIRYYPYQPSVGPGTTSPRKVLNAHKVERLIHIELGEKRALGSGKCKTCSREHREWFEVVATRNGVKEVDEVVRKWVEWGAITTPQS